MTIRLRPLLLPASAVLVVPSITTGTMSRRSVSEPAAAYPSNPADDTITCLGRISPDDGVIKISARSLSGQPSLVSQLLVKQGDLVRRGQVLAVLDSHDQLEAVWRAATARTQVAERRLAQVKAGAKPADVSAQTAEISRLESELSNAHTEFGRYQLLRESAVISPSEFDARKLAVDAKTQEL